VGAAAPLAARLADLPAEARAEFLAGLTEAEAEAVLHDWRAWARPGQLPPEGWAWGWLVLAGRGFGKTRIGAETVREEVEAGRAERIAFVGRTVGEVRTVMIEGESGLQACYPPRLWGRTVVYEPSKRQVQWLAPGQRFVAGREYAGPARRALGLTFSDDEPDQLRGPQHDFAWIDEPAKFVNAWGPRGVSVGALPLEGGTWSNLLLGLRLGDAPRWIATTTPKPVKLIRHLLKSDSVAVTRGSSYDNVENLAPAFVREVLEPYRGTRLERQEIAGELIDEVEGALWAWGAVEAAQARWRAFVDATGRPPEHRRVAVAVDPAVSTGEAADDTAVYVVGKQVATDRYSVIANYSRSRAGVGEWTRAVVDAYHEHRADEVVAEVNNGGDMVEAVIRNADPRIRVVKVHATRGKRIRAEPVALLYDRGLVDHAEEFPALVDQMTSWTPDSDESPDHLDAVVWGLTHLAERQVRRSRAWSM
jgi:phage terminase large subunit-like protein